MAIHLLLVIVGVAIIAILCHGENDRVTKENFDQIADCMTQAEAEEVLGPPTAVAILRNNMGRTVTWESKQTQNHLIYLQIITISFDPSGRKRGTGQYTNCQVDVDFLLSFKDRVDEWSPWLGKALPPLK